MAKDRCDATFVVKLLATQHGTWQGQVTWVDEQATSFFRSDMELLKLLGSAVDQGQAGQ